MFKIVRITHNLRRDIFRNDYDFAWRILEAECYINTKSDISIQDITNLS